MNELFSNEAILITFEENYEIYINDKGKLTILDLSSFLYDFSLLHDLIVLISLPEYKEYNFNQYFWYRNGRSIKPEHKLYLNKINYNSQLELEVIIPS